MHAFFVFYFIKISKFALPGVMLMYERTSKDRKKDSSVGRASTFGAGGCGFESQPHHTKRCKNGTSRSLADARIKGVVLGR